VKASNLFKELKRRLRIRKRWLSLGTFLVLASGIGWSLLSSSAGIDSPPAEPVWSHIRGESHPELPAGSREASDKTMELLRKDNSSREVLLHKNYVCGEVTQQYGTMSAKEIFSLFGEHPDARVMLDSSGKVHMVQDVEDLAPVCRENAYFGMDKHGNLTLFDGIPERERVIRTFFQLDVEHMKSSLPQDALDQLHSGIRITDLADYNSVLSSFSEYASEQPTEPAVNAEP